MVSSFRRCSISRAPIAALLLAVLLSAAGTARAEEPLEWFTEPLATRRAPRAPHLHLERSDPAADTVLRASPAAIRLWFSEGASLPVTRLTLSSGAATIATGKPTRAAGAGQPIVFPLAAPLAAGRYTVKWKTMSADGHAVSGTFAFTVQPTR